VRGGWSVEAQYVAPGGAPVADVPVRELAPGVIERLATTETPQPLLAVVRMRAERPPGGATRIVVCAGIADPGNLGTILRSAEAAGFGLVACTRGTVDPYSPKTVRASAGAIFHVPVLVDADPTALGVPLVGTKATGGEPYTAVDWSGPLGLVIGSEAHGVPADLPIDRWVSIPHAGRAESLNAAMAATLLVFEAQRGEGDLPPFGSPHPSNSGRPAKPDRPAY
jgi:RNA methyltransferase, TrmH family